LETDWLKDLEKIAETDFPQAQRVWVSEQGTARNFASKAALRLCGHAQYEAMENTLNTARKYAKARPDLAELINPKLPDCVTNPRRKCDCVWGAKKATDRLA
jgi:hypothetical protein